MVKQLKIKKKIQLNLPKQQHDYHIKVICYHHL